VHWNGEQEEAWERDGFFIVRGFEALERLEAMLERCEAIARETDGQGRLGDALVQLESKLCAPGVAPERRVSKIFRLHRQEPVFHGLCADPRVLDLVESILGRALDCFLSQFIFKQPGALGQPWHQDAYYFPFDRSPQVGIWLAVTEATLGNGPLWVLPGSQREPVHRVVRDGRPHANYGYVEIVDHDMRGAVPVLMAPGDLLIFHSHLMHRSTDNDSDRLRAAMVYHYAQAGTQDQSEERFGRRPPNQDWLPVRR
jgi:ectoine hydroxylase-related dioxygenase (phytanoyl-CoA dioxygenase family)